MDFSIIICCYNSQNRIVETLNSIERIDYPKSKFEVILVDNNSTDSTTDIILNKSSSSEINYCVIKEKKPGLSHARKLGIEKANGNYFIFCDDDNLLFSNYLKIGKKLFDDNDNIGLAAGENIAISDHTLPDWFVINQELFACGKVQENTGKVVNKSGLWGAGMMGRTNVMKKLYDFGFRHLTGDRVGNKLTGGGDIEISKWHVLIGLELWFCRDLKLYHVMPKQRLTTEYLSSLKEGMQFSSMKMWQDYNFINKALKLKTRKKNLIRLFYLNSKGKIVRLKYEICFLNPSLQSTYKAYKKVNSLRNESIIRLFLVRH